MRWIHVRLLIPIAFALAPMALTLPDEMAIHEDANPPNAPAYVYRASIIIPAPFPSERAAYIEPTQEPTVTPMPAPTVALPVYAQPKLTPAIDAARMREIVAAAGFPPETQDAALAVAWCESNFNPGAVGAAGELGQFQIHPVHFPYLRETFGPAVDIASPEVNAWYAYRLSAGGTDWSHWSCKKVLR